MNKNKDSKSFFVEYQKYRYKIIAKVIKVKKELCLVLETTKEATNTLEKLKREGFNATIVSTESLRHAIDYSPNDHHFFTLRHYEKEDILNGIFCMFVVEEDKLEILKDIIREYTNNFKSTKGFMYSTTIEDYEGSF